MAIAVELEVLTRTRVITSKPHSLVCAAQSLLYCVLHLVWSSVSLKYSWVQWTLSIEDTTGTQLTVLYREVSLIQRLICTQLYVVRLHTMPSLERCPYMYV